MEHTEYIEHLKKIVFDKFNKQTNQERANERYIHSIGVSEMACRLADILKPGDIDFAHKCEIAGLLHDFAKFDSKERLLELNNKYHTNIDFDDNFRHVYHGYIGYLSVLDELKIYDVDILKAIKNHVMGKANMSLIEEIIYISDYIELNRDDNETKNYSVVREIALSGNIKKAVAQEALAVIDYVNFKNRPLNKVSLETYDYYKKYLQE